MKNPFSASWSKPKAMRCKNAGGKSLRQRIKDMINRKKIKREII